MTKLCSGQGSPDADDDDDTADDAADAATADKSNPYMSPFQATQKSGELKIQPCLWFKLATTVMFYKQISQCTRLLSQRMVSMMHLSEVVLSSNNYRCIHKNNTGVFTTVTLVTFKNSLKKKI